jgi:pimeloyl-ACP methyl ester carboxylesterase
MPFIENRGAKIYWDEQGQGAPILLIMGLGYPSDMWHRSRPGLSERYRTIALDNRGVGRSDVPPGPYSIAMMASDAALVLDAAGVESAHIFGVSMGGMIAQEFALQYPRRVWSLILGCTSPGGLHAVAAKPVVLMALMARATMTPERAREVFIPILYDSSTPRERIDEDMEILKNWVPTTAAYMAQIQGVLAWEAYSRLPQIAAPTLVIHGDSDRLVPPKNGELIASRIPGAKLMVIPHASHIFGTDQPQAAHQAIGEFLSQVDQARMKGMSPLK